MDGGSDCHSSNGTIWSRLARFFGREDDESLEKAIIEARAEGEVEPDEESMLLGILRFNDLQVQDTMTPRTDIDCVPEDMLLPKWPGSSWSRATPASLSSATPATTWSACSTQRIS